jgi:hypothetical protein
MEVSWGVGTGCADGAGSNPGTDGAAGALQIDVQTRRQEGSHAFQGDTAARGGVCDPGAMTGSFLVARLHVDLQRVASAVCSPPRLGV